jgi:hypothetical protein
MAHMEPKLFGIRDPSGRVLPTYFSSKLKAKQGRDTLNSELSGHVVVYGPDHRKATSN